MDKYRATCEELARLVQSRAHRDMDARQLAGYLEVLVSELGMVWPGEFEQWKRAYPKRDGSQRWSSAEQTFRKLRREGVALETILTGTERYRAHCQANDRIGTQYVMQAATFLNQKSFEEDWHSPAPKSTSPLPPSAQERREQSLKARRSSENSK